MKTHTRTVLSALTWLLLPAAAAAAHEGSCPSKWLCLPDVTTPVRLLDGDVQCASPDGRNCLWGACPKAGQATTAWLPAERPPHLIPLICGPDHASKYGGDGYGSADHWCHSACLRLGCPHLATPEQAAAPAPADVVLFRDANFEGPSQTLPLGRHDMGALANGIGNDQLSSIRVPLGLEVTVFCDAGFRGRSRSYLTDTPWVGDDMNDCASSLVVARAGAQWQKVVEVTRRLKGERGYMACAPGSRWGCAPLTQGAVPPPGQEPPPACGCIPACPPGLMVMTGYAGGTWPDGSERGAFSCVSTLPP